MILAKTDSMRFSIKSCDKKQKRIIDNNHLIRSLNEFDEHKKPKIERETEEKKHTAEWQAKHKTKQTRSQTMSGE